jgi:hypothetical protein
MNLKSLLAAALALAPAFGLAFDYEGHRTVNQLALASLPPEFPDFVRTPRAAERVAFLAGEPDRWRNLSDLPLRHYNAPDHFFDLDELPLFALAPESVSHFRYEFVTQMDTYRTAHPDEFPAVDPAKNLDRLKGLPGFLPWSINEYYLKLKSGFSSLKVFEELGTPEEIANAQENILYIMGVMGHFVGDGAQPLHTTKHFNGWVGDNPKGYTTNRTFHAWIDGGYLQKLGGVDVKRLQASLRPAQMAWPGPAKAKHEDAFPEIMAYLQAQHQKMVPLYELQKSGKLAEEGTDSPDGREFIEKQIVIAGQMLGDLWFSAWQQAPPDTFLKSQLNKRKLKAGK